MSEKLTVLDEEQAALVSSAAVQWDILQTQKEAHLGKAWEIVQEQGQLLEDVHSAGGRKALDELCNQIGISGRQGYNYINLSKAGSYEFFRSLSTRKVTALLPLLDDPDVEMGKDRIRIGSREITAEQAQGMTREELVAVFKAIRSLERKQSSTQNEQQKEREINKKENDLLRETNEELQKRIDLLTGEIEIDPLDALIDEVDRLTRNLGIKLVDALDTTELNDEQVSRFRYNINYLYETMGNVHAKFNSEYGEE